MKRNDWILIGILCILILGGFGVTSYYKNAHGENVIVYVDKEVYGVYDLKQDGTYEIRTDRGKNVLVIRNGMADMTEADCPDKLCVKQKPISKKGETIVCLPHRVIVEIQSEQTAELDGHAG